MFKKIILHVPHSSADFSAAGKATDERFGKCWREQARDLIDWYTDELFLPDTEEVDIISVVFGTCRTLCDVERLSHDPLEVQGIGITSPRFLCTYMGAYNPRLTEEGDSFVLQMYLDHQYRVASLLVQNHGSLLLDCHSFSSRSTPLQSNPFKLAGVDICIGFNNDFTRPDDTVISGVENWFSERGYRVSANTPFSNSKTVDTPADYRSLMIEVNKSLYIDEKTLEKTEGFDRLHKDLQDLYTVLLSERFNVESVVGF